MAAFVIVSVWAVCAIGWISNIVQIVGMISEPITALLIIKCVGIFAAPLGVILGWVGIF